MRAKLKWTLVPRGLLALLLLAYVAAGPWLAINGIRRLVATGQQDELWRFVDFQRLRDSLRPQLEEKIMRDILATGPAPTAVVCANDRLALGAYQALHEAGLRVPDDVSVVSFDDSELASWMRPALTSIALPHYELGAMAVNLLLGDDREPVVHRCPMTCSTRESLSRPR